MHVFRGESSHRTTGAPARKLWHTLHEVDKYLIGQSGWLVNYAKQACEFACRDINYRRYREFPGQPANE